MWVGGGQGSRPPFLFLPRRDGGLDRWCGGQVVGLIGGAAVRRWAYGAYKAFILLDINT